MMRANNAERRLVNAQNQLAAAEEKMAAMNQKTTAADSKWEARVKEYETRLRAAEEKVKRERQGYKERVLELENQIKYASELKMPVYQPTYIFCSDPYSDRENSLTGVTSNWLTLRPRYHKSLRRPHGSLSLTLFHALSTCLFRCTAV
jgi:chromosome segregation ATPase